MTVAVSQYIPNIKGIFHGERFLFFYQKFGQNSTLQRSRETSFCGCDFFHASFSVIDPKKRLIFVFRSPIKVFLGQKFAQTRGIVKKIF